jgi:hypothetical protein
MITMFDDIIIGGLACPRAIAVVVVRRLFNMGDRLLMKSDTNVFSCFEVF